jgi:hypothetical protein
LLPEHFGDDCVQPRGPFPEASAFHPVLARSLGRAHSWTRHQLFHAAAHSLPRLVNSRDLAMSSQACEPCSRRKVRCDKQQPCSNCKRRKQDQCIYPEATPIDRIKKLESLVKSLGGDPNMEENRAPKRARTGSSPVGQQDAQNARDTTEAERGQPIMLEQNGESYYVEM